MFIDITFFGKIAFQSPRSGKFVSDPDQILRLNAYSSFDFLEFQSPRSGKFVSDMMFSINKNKVQTKCFNPLDRGNLYQICSATR